MKLFAAISLALLIASPAAAETFTVVEHANTDTTNHIGKGADNLGDVLTFTNPVFDAADKNEIGADQGFCIRVKPGVAYECLWTLKLKAGQITVEGPFLDAGDSMLAVTGGTGKYADVRGQMKLHARNAKGTEYDFVYTLSHAGK